MPSPAPQRRTRAFRRTYLAALGTGFLAGLAGCNDGINSERPDSSGEDGNEGMPGGWGQQTKLTPDDDSVVNFGSSVALAGDGRTALVSANNHQASDGVKPGPAYVLGRRDGDWRMLAKLTPDSSDWDIYFGGPGGSSALSDDATTALVGAERAEDPNGPQAGSAYVFERADDTWSQQFELVPDDGDRKDFFGGSVALGSDGTVALIGAKRDEEPNGESAGSAYVFERTDDGWNQQTKLVPDQGNSVARFGWSVALEGDTAIIGAPGDDEPNGEAGGSAYVFQRIGGTWNQQTRLVPDDGDTGDYFGGAVALEGDTAIFGAMEDEDPNGERAGSAYVFERADSAWRQQAKLVPDDGDSIDLFGAAVALTGDGTTALVGARVDEDPHGESAGSTYVFERSDGAWSQQVKLTPTDGQSDDVFGRSVALEGDTALIGTTRGGACVFVNTEGQKTRDG